MSDQISAPPLRVSVPICAIGASAGGVTALQALFAQLPPDLGLAYIIVLHLPPQQPSFLHELLATASHLPTIQVQEATELRPDHLYVISPGNELIIKGDQVLPMRMTNAASSRRPIDTLFRSIAAERGDGIAVVMTGASADGMHGVRAVKEGGGIIMVQDPSYAEYPTMPQSAVDTGVADFIEPVEQIVKLIVEVARGKNRIKEVNVDLKAESVKQILTLTRIRTGYDFSIYKESTVIRRIWRRAHLCQSEGIEDYLKYFRDHPEEAKKLFADLLISVTSFFRDGEAFERLKTEAITHALEAAEKDVRVWAAGCATGEEAYSIAMLLLEQVEQQSLKVQIQVFATDLDEIALEKGRLGIYPRSIEADVSAPRLRRFFIDEGSHYRVCARLREMVLFATHSIVEDPPFTRLDLIVCRNLLIYLGRHAQQQVASIFHYSLKPGGFLFLGPAEAPDIAAGAFETINREARIYRAQAKSNSPLSFLPQTISTSVVPRNAERLSPKHTFDARPFLGDAHLAAIEEGAPPSVLIDAERRVLNLSPSAGRFMLVPGGPLTDKLPSLVRPELRGELMIALDRAFQSRRSIVVRAPKVAFESERRQVLLHVAFLQTTQGTADRALISFLDGGLVDEADETPSSSPHLDEVRRLRVDLNAAQQAALTSRAEHESALQDLRVANEELQSLNEEYRSTAEELETSKEELQSVNEELHTVNSELRSKVHAVTAAHNDLLNLTTSSEIGTLFLDPNLKIRMFTPPIAKLFNISDVDVGRSITDFSHQLAYTDLIKNVRQVLDEADPFEEEIRGANGRGLLLRIRPYRTTDDSISGVVVTFNDITEHNREAAITESDARFKALVVISSDVIYLMNADWSKMLRLEGRGILVDTVTPTESWMESYIAAEDRGYVKEEIEKAVRGRHLLDLKRNVRRRDATLSKMRLRAAPIFGEDGAVLEWLGTAVDAT